MSVSALYGGTVTHRRFSPVTHTLRMPIAMMLLDLDELAALDRRLRLFGAGRPALFGFYERDHGEGTIGGLRAWAVAQAAAAGIVCDGAIRVLCMPRILGHAFNPLTMFFCHRADGGLVATLYQVNNTFGQRHSYVLAAAPAGGVLRQECAKSFYVSPFLDMDLRYRFRIQAPAGRVCIGINATDAKGQTILAAVFAGGRRELTDAALLALFLRQPVLGLRVLAGIHREAVKLWWKGMRIRPRPDAPVNAVSIPG